MLLQALQLGQDASPPYGIFNGLRCHMCLRSDSLLKVMERLANPGTIISHTIFSFVSLCYTHVDMRWELLGLVVCINKIGVRRLVIVEAGSKRVEGIISLSDVFQFLLGLWLPQQTTSSNSFLISSKWNCPTICFFFLFLLLLLIVVFLLCKEFVNLLRTSSLFSSYFCCFSWTGFHSCEDIGYRNLTSSFF